MGHLGQIGHDGIAADVLAQRQRPALALLEGSVGDRILIVEDEKLIRWAIKSRLAEEDFSVVEARNGKDFLDEVFAMEGARLATCSGVEVRDGVDLLYHWAFEPAGAVVTIKVLAARPGLEYESISNEVDAANWIEREMHDLLGANFCGHPDMRRLVLGDSWPDGVHPLRKDFDQVADRPPLPPKMVPPDDPSAATRDPGPGAAQLGVPRRQLQPHRDRLGVDPVGPAHADGVAVLPRPLDRLQHHCITLRLNVSGHSGASFHPACAWLCCRHLLV